MSELSPNYNLCGACGDGVLQQGSCRNCGVVEPVEPAPAPAEAVPAPEGRTELALYTASRSRCFRTCPRLHQLRYVEGWRPMVEAEALRFGTLMHTGLEAWWRQIWALPGERCGTCGSAPEITGICGPCGGSVAWSPLEAALAAVAGRGVDEFEQARADELLRGYDARWLAEAAAYEVVGVETSYRAPMINPATMARSRTWQLAGKIDGLLRRKADQRVLVMEHKTTSERIESDADHYWSTLSIDGQISGYVVGAEALGHRVDEVLYDVIRKPGQEPLEATPTESRKYTKEGRLYANQRDRDETPEEYRARIREAITAEPERFFQRRAIPRTESQIRDYLQDAWQLSRAMRDMELDGHAPRNPDACHRFGSCQMWTVCSTGSHPSAFPAEYRQVADVHPELGA